MYNRKTIDVWTLSDHGNYNLISLDSLKGEEEIPLNCIECKHYNVKANDCSEMQSFFNGTNLTIGKCEFFRKGE